MPPLSDRSSGRVPVADRLYTAEEVGIIVAWFSGREDRWQQHVKDDSDVVNVGRSLAEIQQEAEPVRRVTTPHSDEIVAACVAHGGHYWSESRPNFCDRCWFHAEYPEGKSYDPAQARPVTDNPQA
jgi:hypothetical protein